MRAAAVDDRDIPDYVRDILKGRVMASLYIKDPETAAIAARLAKRLGTTKTEAVRRALQDAEGAIGDAPTTRRWADWIADYRREHPLPAATGKKADKAFFDWLSGEGPDPDA
jgi:antitoxin VapB